MDALLLVVAIIAAAVFNAWGVAMEQNHQSHIYRVNQAEVTSGIQMSENDAMAALQAAAAANNGQITVPPADIQTSRSPCGVVDANNASESDCTNVVDTTIHFSGITTRTGGEPAAGADAIATTVGNVNTATVASGGTFDRVVSFSSTAKLMDPTQKTVITTRVANGSFHVISVCVAISNCTQQTAEIHFDGWRDSNGGHDLAAIEGASGRCDPTDTTCSLQGADNATVDPGVTPGDGRAHLSIACYDPNYVGNGGTQPGDRCNPTGNPAVGPENGDNFTNQALTNDSATNGAYSR
jgi:hypothetical protein